MKCLKGPSFMKCYFIILIIIILFLASCAEAPVVLPEEVLYFMPTQMEEFPVLDYQIPILYPSIAVNRIGYNADGRKIVVIHGEHQPNSFRLINKNSGEVVFIGKLEKRGNNDDEEEYNSYGDFSNYTQVGEYYIECDVIGRSYTFKITEGMYQEILDEAVELILNQAEAPEIPVSEMSSRVKDEWFMTMLLLLLSYELYPAVYTDKDNNQIPDILDAITYMVEDVRGIQEQSTGSVEGYHYVYAAALAKYSYVYQQFDSLYATEILNLAARAWRSGEALRNVREPSHEERYRMLASAELYRATGHYTYRLIIREYGDALLAKYNERSVADSRNSTISSNDLADNEQSDVVSNSNIDGNEQSDVVSNSNVDGNEQSSTVSGNNIYSNRNSPEREEVLAMITYIATRQRVDTNTCSVFIEILIEEAERISNAVAVSGYLSILEIVGGEEQTLPNEEAIDGTIWQVIILSVANYIITNLEYGNMIENEYHYFMGRNPQAYCFWHRDDTGLLIEGNRKYRLQDNPVWTAGFVMMLSEMNTHR